MAKKKSPSIKIEELLSTSKTSQWCNVDVENKFKFFTTHGEYVFKIDESVQQYLVLNKPKKDESGNWNDWTNDSAMERVLCVDDGNELRFFDEKLSEIGSDFVRQV
jgi:hypothetical protein